MKRAALAAMLCVAGCARTDAPTFARDVAPIVYARCAPCHHAGAAAPFALTSFRDVQKRGKTIREVVLDRTMPPWPPSPPVAPDLAFADARALSDAERDAIVRWVETGMHEGEGAPPAPAFDGDAGLGAPELVVEMDGTFDVPAAGPDVLRNFVVPIAAAEDRYVSAVELRSTAQSTLHHAVLVVDSLRHARALDAKDATPGFEDMSYPHSGPLGTWTLGATPRRLPPDFAYALPRGSDVVIEAHFHPSGSAEREHIALALHFAPGKPRRTLLSTLVPAAYGAYAGIDLAPGDAHARIRDSFALPVDVDLLHIGAHAHSLGKTVEATLVGPDGSARTLLSIRDWDFRWQGLYEFARPVRAVAGSRIDAEIGYDNSADNPRNPFSPPRRVRFGNSATDEMGSVIVLLAPRDEADLPRLARALAAQASPKPRSDDREARRARVMKLDRDGDGVLEIDELPQATKLQLFNFDLDHDGKIAGAELEALIDQG